MATVKGTGAADFIHRAGDGNLPPLGFNEVVGVTTGDDTIDGRAGDDIIYGDAGNDTITGGLGTDKLFGGDGNDVFFVTQAAQIDGLAEVLEGGAGNNLLLLSAFEGTVDISNALLTDVRKPLVAPLGTGLNVVLAAEQFSAFSDSIAGNVGTVGLTLSAPGTAQLSGNFFMSGVDSVAGSSSAGVFRAHFSSGAKRAVTQSSSIQLGPTTRIRAIASTGAMATMC